MGISDPLMPARPAPAVPAGRHPPGIRPASTHPVVRPGTFCSGAARTRWGHRSPSHTMDMSRSRPRLPFQSIATLPSATLLLSQHLEHRETGPMTVGNRLSEHGGNAGSMELTSHSVIWKPRGRPG
jgi:hypothetical protein